MGTFTINIPDAEDEHVLASYGRVHGLRDANGQRRAATQQEFKKIVIQSIRNTVDTADMQIETENRLNKTPINIT